MKHGGMRGERAQGKGISRAAIFLALSLVLVVGMLMGVPVEGNSRVIGSDGRQLVADTTAFPYNCVVKVVVRQEVIRKSDGNREILPSGGSGILINEDTVLTAAHVIESLDSTQYSTTTTSVWVAPAVSLGNPDTSIPDLEFQIRWSPIFEGAFAKSNFLGFDYDTYLGFFPFGFAQGKEWFFDPAYNGLAKPPDYHDLGIIKLDRPISLPQYPGVLVANETWWNSQPRLLNAVGYPWELDYGKRMYESEEETDNSYWFGWGKGVLTDNEYTLEIQCDLSKGQSGGPVFFGEQVVGVNSIAYSDDTFWDVLDQTLLALFGFRSNKATAFNNYENEISAWKNLSTAQNKPDFVIQDFQVNPAGGYFFIDQGIGYELDLYNIGTKAAENFTLSFYLLKGRHPGRVFDPPYSVFIQDREISQSLGSFFSTQECLSLSGTVQIPQNLWHAFSGKYTLVCLVNYRNPIDEFSGNGGGDFQEEYPGNVFSVPVFLLPPLVSPPNTRSLSVDSQEAGVQFRFSVEGQEETTPFSGNWEENDTVSLSLGSSQYKDQDGIVEGNDVLYSVGWRDGAPLSRTETMNVDKDLGIVANQVKYKVERGVEGIPESAASISWPSEWVFEGSYQSFQVLDTVVEVGGTDFGFKKWILSYEGGETYDTSASMGRSINRPVKVVALFEPLEAVDNPTSYITVNISSGFLNPSSATLPRYSLYKVLGSVGVPYSGVDAYVEDYIEDGNTLFLGTFDGEPGRDFNLKPGEVYFLFAPELVEEGVRHMNTGVEINGEQGLGHWGSYHVLYAGDSGHTQIEDLHHNDTVKNLFTETLEYYVTFETYPSNVGSLSKGNGWYETLDKWGNSDEVRVYADDDGDWVLDHWEVNGLSYFRGHNYSMFPGNIEVDSSGGLNIEVVYEPTQVIGVYRYEPTFELTFSRGIKEPENFPGINLTGAFELVLNGESQQGPISHVVEEYGDLEITVPKQLEMEVTSVFSGPDTRFDIDYLYEFADTTYQVPELSNSQFLDDRFCFQLNNILADGSFSFLYNPCFAFQQTTVPAGLQPYQTLAELQVPRSYYLGGIEALSREMPMYAQNESTQQLYRYRETLIQDIQGVRVESERNFEIQPGISPTKVEGRFDPVYPFSLVSEPFSGLELDLYRDGVWLEKITTPVEKILGEGSWRFQGPKEIQGDYTDWVEGNDILLLFATGTNLEEFSYSSGGDTLTFSWVPLENDQKTYSQQLEYEVYLKVCQEDNVGSPQHEQWILANSVMTRTPVPVEGFLFDHWNVYTSEGNQEVLEETLEFTLLQPVKIEAIYVSSFKGGVQVQYPHNVNQVQFQDNEFLAWVNLLGLEDMKSFQIEVSSENVGFSGFSPAEGLFFEPTFELGENQVTISATSDTEEGLASLSLGAILCTFEGEQAENIQLELSFSWQDFQGKVWDTEKTIHERVTDFDGNELVEVNDLGYFAGRYGLGQADVGFDPALDFNLDNKIDFFDLAYLINYWDL